MGNQIARGTNRMAISAMANVTHVERKDLQQLSLRFKEIVAKEGGGQMLSRKGFTEAMTIVGINQNDADILDRLFTMYDKTGDDLILYKEFLAGISPFITGSYVDKIEFAFSIYDTERTMHLRANDLINVLSQINRVSSYFGDAVLTEEQIVDIIKDSLELAPGAAGDAQLTSFVRYQDYVKVIADHANIELFLSGGGKVQYGTGH